MQTLYTVYYQLDKPLAIAPHILHPVLDVSVRANSACLAKARAARKIVKLGVAPDWGTAISMIVKIIHY